MEGIDNLLNLQKILPNNFILIAEDHKIYVMGEKESKDEDDFNSTP
ncbi:MAG: hypothetical protein ACFFCM_02600 [Promethearchaeota archaeon]